jgi:hypothetical protein
MTDLDVIPVVNVGANQTQQISGADLKTYFTEGISANTGNVTFSDQIVIGTGVSNLVSGLYLAPSSSSADAVQYLRVRGDTGYEPTHIHFDTGNNQYFNQFIGDDNKYVLLSNTGNIVIRTDDYSVNSAQWTFGTDGELYLSTGGRLGSTKGGTMLDGGNANSVSLTSFYGNGYYAGCFTANPDGNVTITTYTGSDNYQWQFDNAGVLTMPGGGASSGNITGANVVTANTFSTTGTAGDLELTGGNITGANVISANVFALTPGGGTITQGIIPAYTSLTGNTIVLTPSGGTSADQQLVVYPTVTPGADSNHLHLTSGNLYNTELFLGDDFLYVKLANTGNIVVNTNDNVGNSAQWTFGTDGNLTAPGNIGVGATGTSSAVNIQGVGAGDVVGYQTMLSVVSDDGAPYAITVQNATAGLGKGLGVYVEDTGNIGFETLNTTSSFNFVTGPSPFNTWTFTADGNLTAPGNITATNFVGNLVYTPYYGSFYDTTTQNNSNVGNAIPVRYNTTDINNGVTVTGTGSTEIRIANTGIYNIQFSLQVLKTDAGQDTIYLWLDKNGGTVPNTGTGLFLVGNNAAEVVAWNFVVSAAANDYYRLMWMSPDANAKIISVAATGPVPAIPSAILTVVPVGA